MYLSVCPQPFYRGSLDDGLAAIAELGFGSLELPVDARSPWIDLEEHLANGASSLKRALTQHGLTISAISNHQEGQLVFGPHHRDTDEIFAGTPAEKRAYALERLRKSARLAAELEVPTVIGFLGCEDYTRAFPWPAPDGWERMRDEFCDVVGPLLDEFDRLGVAFGHEPHPKQFIYNTETAGEVLGWLDGHSRLGFNLDPANLLLAGVDPCVFVQEHASRIWHVHAKDGELVPHHARRSGLLAHGPWHRVDRGFRFRIPGWGDIPWKRLISELQIHGYRGALAIENEDPVFAPLDGIRKAMAELTPLLPDGPPEERWW